MNDFDSLPANLTRPEASEYLLRKFGIRRTPKTLAKIAVTGGGPKFCRDTRLALYPICELDTWAASLLSDPAATTAEHQAA